MFDARQEWQKSQSRTLRQTALAAPWAKGFVVVLLVMFSGVWFETYPESANELNRAEGFVYFEKVVTRGRGASSMIYLHISPNIQRVLPPEGRWTPENVQALTGRKAKAYWKPAIYPLWPFQEIRQIVYRLEIDNVVIYDIPAFVKNRQSVNLYWRFMSGVLAAV